MSIEEDFIPNPFGGALGTANTWLNFFKGWDALEAQVPGLKTKGTMDTLTVMTGANDRMTLFGPSMVTNFGAGYSTSFDPIGFGVNRLASGPAKVFLKALLGSGDIKLAFGPSTSLLYGGPGGSSKRGPYWERIAGTWWDPRRKGSKYSAEGSFTPSSVGKKSGDGLQFFERDQIFGEDNYDGAELATMINSGRRSKPVLSGIAENVAPQGQQPIVERHVKLELEVKPLGPVKEDKYESDLEKCYTKDELKLLETGDKAARYGTMIIGFVDISVAILSIIYANQIKMAGPSGGSFTTDRAGQVAKARGKYDEAIKTTTTTKTDLENWDSDPSRTSDNDLWQAERAKKQAAYDKAVADETAKKQAWQDLGYKTGNPGDQNQRDLDWGKIWAIFRLAHRLIKIVGLTLIETFENTERLARHVLEHKGGAKTLINDYVQNEHLKLEKRQPEYLLKLANLMITSKNEQNTGLTQKQLEDYGKNIVRIIADRNRNQQQPVNQKIDIGKVAL
jgi:hypothetical protein